MDRGVLMPGKVEERSRRHARHQAEPATSQVWTRREETLTTPQLGAEFRATPAFLGCAARTGRLPFPLPEFAMISLLPHPLPLPHTHTHTVQYLGTVPYTRLYRRQRGGRWKCTYHHLTLRIGVRHQLSGIRFRSPLRAGRASAQHSETRRATPPNHPLPSPLPPRSSYPTLRPVQSRMQYLAQPQQVWKRGYRGPNSLRSYPDNLAIQWILLPL
ncbi:hypothetical protein K431DRAFT_47293 [Polychaeton citri CBS 116435]|uniref:Uncharacterized protein n=1 Tax=Polychaeton citri CBS 116435 TaxID=1314669 RepID=A0A9P4QCW8_9PEZI|nr:hypothetical protein K431DRAFT_47293 [Polychaeton citri CBS 116435]